MTTNFRYDAILVLGQNITKKPDGSFGPTTYADHDEFGLLGGQLRCDVAALMYLRGECSTFVFSTGTSEKTKAKFGPNVPTEAQVYAQEFLRKIEEYRAQYLADLPAPTIILEEHSQNTVGNIRECFTIIDAHGWHNIGVMSAEFHLPRIRIICEHLQPYLAHGPHLNFILVEEKIRHILPGVYDTEIAAAYASEQGQKRLRNEAQGVRDMQNGTYVMGEFQLDATSLPQQSSGIEN